MAYICYGFICGTISSGILAEFRGVTCGDLIILVYEFDTHNVRRQILAHFNDIIFDNMWLTYTFLLASM